MLLNIKNYEFSSTSKSYLNPFPNFSPDLTLITKISVSVHLKKNVFSIKLDKQRSFYYKSVSHVVIYKIILIVFFF